jgi:hypothetical protein
MRPPNPPIWTEQYEALRRHAVDGDGRLGSDPLGAILVVRSGVAEWMRQWSRISAEGPAVSIVAAPPPLRREPAWQRELTVVLAGMTACHLGPVSTS